MKLNTKTSADTAAISVRALILNGKLKTGQPIRQDVLSKQLGMSRTPLRQALQMLDKEGLVTISDFKGAAVTQISATLLDDLFEMRLVLEPMVLASALPRLTKLNLAEAEMALDEARDETAPDKLSMLNWRFHNALYAPSERKLLLETLHRLNSTAAFAEVIANSIAGRTQQSQAEHLVLLAACRQSNASSAIDILKQHLTLAHAEARASFEE
jgi:DNA-binding GntR family transcriptional regulator